MKRSLSALGWKRLRGCCWTQAFVSRTLRERATDSEGQPGAIRPEISPRLRSSCRRLTPRGHQGHDSAQSGQKREKNGPVSLLLSARMKTEKETKNGRHHVNIHRDDLGNVFGRRFLAPLKRVRHRDLSPKPYSFACCFVAVPILSVARFSGDGPVRSKLCLSAGHNINHRRSGVGG